MWFLEFAVSCFVRAQLMFVSWVAVAAGAWTRTAAAIAAHKLLCLQIRRFDETTVRKFGN